MKSLVLSLSQMILTLALYVLGAVVIGISLVPAVLFVSAVWLNNAGKEFVVQVTWTCMAAAGGYFLFGLTLMLAVGLLRTVSGLRLREGHYKIGSTEMLKWFFVNALFLSVRTVFIEFTLLTPFCNLFYRLMGARVGLNVQINSKNVADHSLLEIGDHAVIGGNATVIGHSFESQGLRLAKVNIGKKVIVGLNAVIMPGVVIGDGAIIAAGAIVPKQTVVEPGVIYFSPDRQVKKNSS